MPASLLDNLAMSTRDKRMALAVAQQLHRCGTRIMCGLVEADVIDDPEMVVQSALALLLEARMRTPMGIAGD